MGTVYSLKLDDVVDGLDDVVGGDPEHLEQLCGRPGPRHRVHGQLPHDHVAVGRHRVQHSVADTTLPNIFRVQFNSI